ncbi:GRAM domain-containing protein [Paenibacillus sp. SN-8-1]|uniref:GRAM domain-containing protein n=1 Tax=Paenibacillus sp. SN-8-1 TaxID=3435409 RepID=UPI003D9A1359
MEVRDQEVVLIHAQANYYKSAQEQLIGDLIVTSQRTIFESKKVSIFAEDMEISHDQIKYIEKFNFLSLIPSGLKIVTVTGEQFKFRTANRDGLIKAYIQTQVTVL